VKQQTAKKHKHAHKKHHHHHHDSEFVQLSDYNADDLFHAEENEDAEILKSIAYAEKKLGSKMGTPERVPTPKGQPIMYDVETLSQKSRTGTVELAGMITSQEEKSKIGDCDDKDFACQHEATSIPTANSSVSELKQALNQEKKKNPEPKQEDKKKETKEPVAKPIGQKLHE